MFPNPVYPVILSKNTIRVDLRSLAVKTMFYKSLFCVPCDLSRLIKIAVGLLCCSALSCLAELTWEQKVIRLDVHPLQVEGKASFHFKNTGTNTVDILAVRTTCGCTKASASTNQVAPGESGSIDAIFNYRDKIGPQRKAVALRTSDSKPTILYLEANIQSAYNVSAKRLEWSLHSVAASDESGKGRLYDPKTCCLINQLHEPVHLVSATSSLDSFTVELIPIREGFEYEVQVVPIRNASPGRSVITIQPEHPPELQESRTYTFTATLR